MNTLQREYGPPQASRASTPRERRAHPTEPAKAAVPAPVTGAGARWWVGRLLLRRAGYVAVVVWSVYTLSFFLLYALPGNPIAIMLERRSAGAGASNPEALHMLSEKYGYDQPVLVRYATTLGQFLRGDLGVSFQSGKPVTDVLAAVASNTITLAIAALVLAVPGSMVLALVTSWRPGGVMHRVLVNVPALIASVPAFWLGLILLQVFSFQLHWFPSSGGTSVAGLVLPAVALAVPVSASLTAVLVRALDEAERAGWVELLRSRGLPWWRIYLGHIARNAMLPFVTVAGLTVAGVLVGTVITETVFARSGLGRLLVSSIETQDAPVVLAIATLAAVVFAVVNFAVDLLYPVIDPRLRHRTAGGS